MDAVRRGARGYQERLHDYERPVAHLTSLTANLNRDAKKNKKGYTYEDVSFYRLRDDMDLPDSAYGSAAIELIKRRQMPPWALFCYKQLAESADPAYVPNNCALIAEDAILLHPIKKGSCYTGLLIAQESAGEQRRVFVDDYGNEIALTVPYIDTKTVAIEDVNLEM